MNNFKKIPPIVIHVLLWTFFLIISASQIYYRIGSIPQDFIIRSFTLILAFYLNFNLLVPYLLLNKKIPLYFLVLLAFSFFFSFILHEFLPRPIDSPPNFNSNNFPKLPPPENHGPLFLNFRGFFPSGGLLLLIFTLSTSIKLGLEWFKSENKRVAIESEKVNSELSFLKAQLNPHFLFNSLNSIYSLAHKQSKDTTNAIVILSDLMRYMIYETNKDLVPLEKEIEYIKNYVSLQLLRLKDSSNVKLNIHGNLKFSIEPLLLISFIENAFKYGTDFTGKTNVNIKITIDEELLTFNVFNSVTHQQPKTKDSGVGLENIKNRLNLLYPNKHNIVIKNEKNSYEVNLTLKLKTL
ncbi:sensor histidine kinase [Tamlana sp. 62-3]|uniref:Sensor histidine kinase n=1 Tax=Neotamlana sargassicola TaxID=2883125 RepID=A0A9X1I9X7_9FLAO|nr:sensor histidine kinase [Tamlana sargassicola]MCB4809459.1 sensor histidine kinase [Tamlana sargassicola]